MGVQNPQTGLGVVCTRPGPATQSTAGASPSTMENTVPTRFPGRPAVNPRSSPSPRSPSGQGERFPGRRLAEASGGKRGASTGDKALCSTPGLGPVPCYSAALWAVGTRTAIFTICRVGISESNHSLKFICKPKYLLCFRGPSDMERSGTICHPAHVPSRGQARSRSASVSPLLL